MNVFFIGLILCLSLSIISLTCGDNISQQESTFFPISSETGRGEEFSPIFTLLTPEKNVSNYQPPPIPVNIINQTGTITNIPDPLFSLSNQTSTSVSPIQPDLILNLSRGWNFVSTPRSLSIGNNTASIFNKIDSRGHSMYRYDAVSGWIKVTSTDLITPLEGFWVFSAFPSRFPLFFKDELVISPVQRTLQAGWNTIGISGTTPKTLNQTLQSISDKWLFLIPFNSTSQLNNNPLIRGWKDINGEEYTLEPGKGYWIYMTSPGDVTTISAEKDISFSGTVDYKVSEQGWTITLPGTISGTLSPETGKLQIFSSDAHINYGGKSYPITMNVDASLKK
ncbi:MAG: hypothetical protein CVV33_01240 [Methanomicrobiales archaeon HGW-Methanomicrobiales-4]|nr:MAG: hypothetical protein CVV33_01240 [Methanomicrobiales archaeon HGW-Methanomicrobiales-4]